MTLGTTEADAMINSYKELFRRLSFDELIFIRTNNQNSVNQEIEIKKILKEKKFYTFEIKNYEDLEDLLKELVFSKDKKSLVNLIKEKEKDGFSFILDITGGIKVMSSALVSILVNTKNLEEITYIGGIRGGEGGRVTGLPKVYYTSKNTLSFFSNFYIYLEENLRKKNYLELSNFLLNNKDYFFNPEWELFVDLIDFYANLFRGKFSLIKESIFLNESFDRSVFERIIENKSDLYNFFEFVKYYINLRKKNLSQNLIKKRAIYEMNYFLDLLSNNVENKIPIETLAYFYTFFEKLVNLVLLDEGFKKYGFKFFVNEKIFYLCELDDNKREKIVGLQRKIKLVQNKDLKRFFKKGYEEIVEKVRNVSIVGHGEKYPNEEICFKVKDFIDDFFMRFDSFSKNYRLSFFVYPVFKIENIFFCH